MNIMDFISSIIKNIDMIKNYLNETTEKLIEKINDFIEKYDKSKSINDVFIEIKKQLIENRISETDINTIKKILNIASFSRIIIYDVNLNYTIPEINS
jgi:acetolactate synthase small subunit